MRNLALVEWPQSLPFSLSLHGKLWHEIQRCPNPPEFHSPVLRRSDGSHPSERVQTWVCLFLYGWYYPGSGYKLVCVCVCVFLICVISSHSNGAVQIRVVWSTLRNYRLFGRFNVCSGQTVSGSCLGHSDCCATKCPAPNMAMRDMLDKNLHTS